jgi:hypothetical protein
MTGDCPAVRYGTAVLAAALTIAAGCTTPTTEGTAAGDWVGTITTEGNVTTVVNESGSVWDGSAGVVEEVAIGVEAGPDELMFGSVDWVYEHGGTIYVVDSRVPAVRMFDLDGNFLGNLGAPGQGPGEYMRPWRLTVAPDGRIFVSDRSAQRINVYAADGTPIDTWQTIRMTSLLSASLHVDEDGVLWIPIATALSPEELWQGVQALVAGEPGERAVIEQFAGEPVAPTPAEHVVWTPYAGGALIVGRPETHGYRFEVQRLGATVLAVERVWEPIAVDPEYAAWYLAAHGDERPAHWPPIMTFTRAEPDEIWVTRQGPMRRIPGCEADVSSREAARARSCWSRNLVVDVFGDDGRYRGEIELPDDVSPVPQWMHADGDLLIAQSLDQDGVMRVKRFRIVRPDSPSPSR